MHTKKIALALACTAIAACNSNHHHDGPEIINERPSYLGTISSKTYDGTSDDLLTAGLGATGLAGALPAYADPLSPTAAELRRNAIYANYRAILDINAAAGYGRLYGPNVDAAGVASTSEGKIAGSEFIAYADDGSGQQNVTLMVQIPTSFDINNPCIVTGASSGSRGIYGAIGTAVYRGFDQELRVS